MDAHVGIVACNGSELFAIKAGTPRTNRKTGQRAPDIFNLTFCHRGSDEAALAGGGIYAVRYKGELLYVGIFTGDKYVPFAGNVARERISKHLEALSMRGRRVGFAATNYDRSIKLPGGPLVDAIRSSQAQRDSGGVRSYPSKVEFAAQHWQAMSVIERDPTVITDFELVYGRIDAAHYRPDITYRDLKGYLAAIEDGLIQSLKPRCNERYSTPNRARLRNGPPESAWDGLGQMLATGDWNTDAGAASPNHIPPPPESLAA